MTHARGAPWKPWLVGVGLGLCAIVGFILLPGRHVVTVENATPQAVGAEVWLNGARVGGAEVGAHDELGFEIWANAEGYAELRTSVDSMGTCGSYSWAVKWSSVRFVISGDPPVVRCGAGVGGG